MAVCKELARLTPGGHEKRSALFNSGAETVENAVKVARAYTHRQAVIVFDHAYHGRTNLTMALTAKNMPYKHSFGPFAPEIYRMPMAYPFRWPTGADRCGEEAAAEVVALIDKQLEADNVACVVIEPIQGEGGVRFVTSRRGTAALRRLPHVSWFGWSVTFRTPDLKGTRGADGLAQRCRARPVSFPGCSLAQRVISSLSAGAAFELSAGGRPKREQIG